jgi:beta-N-acetylglucosaminidase
MVIKMKNMKFLILILVVLLSSCTTTTVPDEVDCSVTPNHVDCVPEEVDCSVTPDHEDCIPEEVDCNVTPNHIDCIPEEVDCNVTPNHEECIPEEVDCDITPNHEECIPEEVDCEVTPNHPECIVEEPVIIESCEVRGIADCPFVLAEAFSDGSFTAIASYDILREADAKLEESTNPNIVVLYGNKVMVIKYGAINFKTKSISETTLLAHLGMTTLTYLNGNYNVDGLYLDVDNIFTRGVVAGVEFELLTNEVELIPHVQTKNGYSYYTNTNNELIHHISAGIKDQSYWQIGPIDQAPSYLVADTKYYSYDNHYFYTDIITMTDDINNKTRENAVNSDNPYYNYYQYLSFRSKTNYTAEELDSYLNQKVSSYSVLRDSGQDFINAQEDVFINAALELAFAIHESGWGNSLIAVNKNNLFGINAVDSSPYDSATSFDSVEDCVEYHVQYFLQTRYFNPTYNVSFGTNIGNKYQGINYKYASDAYWGEKIAQHYYNLDKALGFKDYNHYKIVLLDPDTIGYYGPNSEGLVIYDSSLYNYYGLVVPFVVMRETDEFYILQLPLGLDDDNKMAIDEIMTITDVFYVLKEDATPIN